jgi:hypothetical protein
MIFFVFIGSYENGKRGQYILAYLAPTYSVFLKLGYSGFGGPVAFL